MSSKSKYVIAGHSSGAAIANALADQTKQTGRISLVDLDGFVPSRALQAKVPTTCVYATNSKTNLMSRNASAMRSGCVKPAKRIVNDKCKTAWCLHFATVNKTVPADLVNFRVHGYDGCGSNVDWL